MTAPRREHYYTSEEYLALERQATYKSEFIAGQIVAMSGVRWEHSLITGNLLSERNAVLRDQPCTVHASDLRVQVRNVAVYTYPDIIVVCAGGLDLPTLSIRVPLADIYRKVTCPASPPPTGE